MNEGQKANKLNVNPKLLGFQINCLRINPDDLANSEKLATVIYSMIESYTLYQTRKGNGETDFDNIHDIKSAIFIKCWKVVNNYDKKPVRNWFSFLTQVIKLELMTQTTKVRVTRQRDNFIVNYLNRDIDNGLGQPDQDTQFDNDEIVRSINSRKFIDYDKQ